MTKTIASIIVMGLLMTSSMTSVTAFEKGELSEQSQSIKFISIPCANIYVDDDNIQGPWDGTYEHPYKKIQDGIAAATNYDIIYVFNGIYYENVVIDKSIVLRGENKNSTIIDGSGRSWIVNIKACGATIERFTIQNASGTWCYGIQVYCFNNLINNNLIKENIVTSIKSNDGWARGIFVDGFNNIVTGNNITNINGNYAWGIELYEGYSNTVIGNNIAMSSDLNRFTFSIEICNSPNNSVTNNDISMNDGYGIVISRSSNNSVTNNDISMNDGEGIEICRSYNNTIKGNTIISNDGKSYFEGILLLWSFNNNIEENTISKCVIGIDVHQSGYNKINGNTIGKSRFLFDPSPYIRKLNGCSIVLFDSNYTTITRNNFIKNDKDPTFIFSYYLKEGENYVVGQIPDGYNEIRNEKDLSNTWSQNYWDRPRLSPKTITGELDILKITTYGEQLLGTINLYNYDQDPLSESSTQSHTSSQQTHPSSQSSEQLSSATQQSTTTGSTTLLARTANR